MKIRPYFVGAIVPALLGLMLAQLLGTQLFVLAQSALGAMTFIVVEILGALLID